MTNETKMKKVHALGTYLEMDGALVKVVGIADGRTLHLQVVEEKDWNKCPHCQKPIPTTITVLESANDFQERAHGVLTITQDSDWKK